MPAWCAASVLFFVYVLALAAGLPRVPRGGRLRAAGASVLGLLCVALATLFPTPFWARSLLIPVATLLLAYRASGFLWCGQMRRVEAVLDDVDDMLRLPELARRTPAAIAEFFELAYAGVYPLIPLALALHLSFASAPDADWFWAVILITDYVCFAMLPWLQTRPPRALDHCRPWNARLRAMNLGILNGASIRMNTLPSGHAAEALACALVVLDAPAPIVAWMFFNAAAISAAAVFGRYHYAIDVVAGWIVALVVWQALRV